MVKARRHLLLQVRAAVLNGDLRGVPRLQTAETGPSIEDRVDVRADAASAQGGVAPQLIYRSPSYQFGTRL